MSLQASSRATVLLYGILGRTPFAGVAWQVLHYLEGLRRLGCEVFYVEDTGDWPYDADRNTVTDDPSFTLRYIERTLGWCGMSGRWAYRAASREGAVLGVPESELRDLLARADALVNLTGATILREEHLRVPVRIYLETDPVMPQIEVARGRRFTLNLLDAHTHHFSYGENLGAEDCGVPVERYAYLPTRPPVVVDWWDDPQLVGSASPTDYTTIASWRQRGKDVEWQGERYTWSKHEEFEKLLDLPSRSGCSFRLALAAVRDEDVRRLEDRGWKVEDGLALSRNILGYRDFVAGSRGEFTVAKDQNVRLRSGWFSDRSATYLAAGRPVVTQDTGFDCALPVGRGLLAFRDLDGAVDALDAIEAHYGAHCRAAREIARQHFSAERVVGDMLERAGL